MPFYRIQDKYIFLYHSNYNKLNEIALKDKDSSFRVSSIITGSEACKEAEMLREKTIFRLYDESAFEEFYYNWIYFYLNEHKVILLDLPYLFYDYGCINHLFYSRKIHENHTQILFPDLSYDKDCSYELSLISTKSLFRKQQKIFSTIIDTREILSVEGELNNFTIEMTNKYLHFGKMIKIIDK